MRKSTFSYFSSDYRVITFGLCKIDQFDEMCWWAECALKVHFVGECSGFELCIIALKCMKCTEHCTTQWLKWNINISNGNAHKHTLNAINSNLVKLTKTIYFCSIEHYIHIQIRQHWIGTQATTCCYYLNNCLYRHTNHIHNIYNHLQA